MKRRPAIYSVIYILRAFFYKIFINNGQNPAQLKSVTS